MVRNVERAEVTVAHSHVKQLGIAMRETGVDVERFD
jgi:hypothetical protein